MQDAGICGGIGWSLTTLSRLRRQLLPSGAKCFEQLGNVVTVEVAAHVDGGTVAIGAAGDGGGALQLPVGGGLTCVRGKHCGVRGYGSHVVLPQAGRQTIGQADFAGLAFGFFTEDVEFFGADAEHVA